MRLPFTGEFRHTMDAKGRLIVPSQTREELEGDGLVLSVWMEGCIAVWSPETWERLNASLEGLGKSQAAARKVHRMIFPTVNQQKVDKQGRISIPPSLREKTGIEREVVVIGVGDHAEIWDPARLRDHRGGDDEQLEQLSDLAEGLEF